MVSAGKKLKYFFEYKIVRYGFLGVLATTIHVLVTSLYIYFINNLIYQSNIIGFLFAFIFSYTMQSKFVFEHKINIEKAFKYFIIQFTSLQLSILISGLFETYNNYLKTLVIVIALPLITFVMHKIWTFKE